MVDEPFNVIQEKINADAKKNKRVRQPRPKKENINKTNTKKEQIREDIDGNRFIPILRENENPNDLEDDIKVSENPIEFQMKTAQAPRSEIEAITDAQLQIHKEKTNITDKFLASRLQKTEVKKDHRVIIPILKMLATNPFPNIACHIGDPVKRAAIEAEFHIDYLAEFIEGFIEFGIPVDRKGRKEEVEVIGAYLRQQESGVQVDQKQNRGYR